MRIGACLSLWYHDLAGMQPAIARWIEQVSLRLGNGRDAQVWAVPAVQAQAIDDGLRHGRGVVLDLLLKLTAAQPAVDGGTTLADVLEYPIRARPSSRLLGRVQPAPR